MAAQSGNLEAARFFVMRTPLLPFEEWLSWSEGLQGEPQADRALLWSRLRDVFDRPICRHAMFLAAPRVEAELARLKQTGKIPDDKLLRTLVRYFARMTGRATPFGLFAGCSLGRVGPALALRLEGSSQYRCFTTLDVGHLLGMTEPVRAASRAAKTLCVRANPSLYRVGDRLRFVEARTDEVSFARSYHLSAVDATDVVETVVRLAADPIPLGVLVERFCNEADVGWEEAFEFAVLLLNEQVLIDNLEPAVTGEEPLRDVVARLATVQDRQAQQLRDVLSDVERELRMLDKNGLGTSPAQFRELLPRLSKPGTSSGGDRIFQADLFKPAPQATISDDIFRRVCDAALLLSRLTPAPRLDSLARFREAFQRKFEGCELPLLEALDADLGVGFEVDDAPDEDDSPWLAGLPLRREDSEMISWGPRETHLLRRVLETVDARAQVLELTAHDIDALALHGKSLPRFFAAMATIAASSRTAPPKEDTVILLHGAYGASGAELLGRFCQGDRDLAAAVSNWLHREEKVYEGALLAEIVHLPQGRTGNIVCRPVLRSHEILCLAQSGAPIDRQIPLSDLTVRLAGQRVVLRSRSLDRDIVPRMTTAHYGNFADLVHYRFLWNLHLQDSAGLSWQWGPMSNAPFLPRVTYRNIVFCRATWRLLPADFAAMSARTETISASMQRLREARGLPRHVLLLEGDMALPLDLENVLCADVLAVEARRGPVTLVEQFPAADQLCASGPEGHFVHEIILPVHRTVDLESTSGRMPQRSSNRHVGRSPAHPPAESWLTAAIYGSKATLDRFLLSAIPPLVERLRSTRAIDRWFFIRYWDPAAHLRVRFQGTPERLRNEAWTALQQELTARIASGEIHAVRLDTYFPELNRYGGPQAISVAECFFEADSDMAVALLTLQDDRLADLREHAAVLAADALMRDFELDEEAREMLAAQVGAALMAEGMFAPDIDKALSERFRALRGGLDALLTDPLEQNSGWGSAARKIIARRSAVAIQYRDTCRRLEREGALTTTLSDILGSLIHMQVNRLMRGAPRAVELVIYDVLRRHYRSNRARKGPIGRSDHRQSGP
jgi:lantibiotic biosynthesis protein